MRKYGLVATASFCFFMAPMFALTVELVNEYQVSAAPVLAAASETQPSSPGTPNQDIGSFVGSVRPAVFPTPESAPSQFPSVQIRNVDTNYPRIN